MPKFIEAATLKAWLHEGHEIALLDVREAGQFADAHLFYAIPLPYSRLEIDIERLVPRHSTPIALCDDGTDDVSSRAATRLTALGYRDVRILEGGIHAWKDEGYELFAGVNVPSKAFGELIEHAWHTPRVSARELQAMQERREDFVIVDGRPFAEYRKMNIPGGICCPNGELALRIGEIAPNPATKIVVNCAGRTRSIIGAETLRAFGVPNPIVALENGTQGWFLEGLEMETGATRKYPGAPTAGALASLRDKAQDVAHHFNIPVVSSTQVDTWLADDSRTTFLFDVRTEEEFKAGTLAGAAHAPGGQLVQATDQWVGVKGARIVLADGEMVRAFMIATWLRQMGHDASVLEGGVEARLAFKGRPTTPLPPPLESAGIEQVEGARLLDLRPSLAYRAGHAAGARWSTRSRIANDADGATRVAIIADDPLIARLAAVDLRDAGIQNVRLCTAQLPIVSTPTDPPDADCIDFVFFTAGRHDGNREASLQYLRWEMNLLNQLDDDEREGFNIRPLPEYGKREA
ncbi:MAG: rhodanese-like domain-containing protein [Burkholderiales bacterium]